ncbi:MAG TPA: hypothetical protein VHA11_04375 [Bryobacteraceae bacterium]|nr:hypothetical protein [Bryobacteraceae bacterium]
MRKSLRIAAIVALAAALYGQSGTTPKAAPSGYPAQARAGELSLGAEYLIHSLPAPGGNFFLEKYLVVEVAVYPPADRALDLTNGMFTLRVFGKKKQELRPDSPGMVAYVVEQGDWRRPTGLQAAAGPVVLGAPERVPRFPGDPTAPQPRTQPVPPQAPGGIERPAAATASDAIREAALPEGPAKGPVSGFLFFPYKGKLKSIESAQLVFHGAGEVVVPLF